MVSRFVSTRLPGPPLMSEPPPLMLPENVRAKAGLRALIVLGKPLSTPAPVGVVAPTETATPPVSGPEYVQVIAAPPVIWKKRYWKECSPGASTIEPEAPVVVTPAETTEVPSM